MAHKNSQGPSLISALPTFGGAENENIKFFISQIRSVASMEKWSEEKSLLLLKCNLKNNAINFITENEKAMNATSFDELASLLLEKYAKHESFEEIQVKFSSIQQQTGQSIKDLGELIDKWGNKYFAINDNSNDEAIALANRMKLQKLYESMFAELRSELKKFAPKTFEAAIKKACDIQNAMKDNIKNQVSQIEINSLLKSQIETNQQLAKIQKIIEQPSSSNVNFSTGNENVVNNVMQNQAHNRYQYSQNEKLQCLICGKFSHLTINCWYHPKNFQQKQFRDRNNHYNPYFRRGTMNNRPNRNFRNENIRHRGKRYNRNFRDLN